MKWRGYCDSYSDAAGSSSQPQSRSSSNTKLIHTKKAPLLLVEPSVNSIRFANDDQRDYFAEWSNLSVTYLGGFVDQTRLWTTTMPQVTLEDSTLRYGAMAVGALRKAYQEQGSEIGLELNNRHYLNAIVYYCEALRMQSEMKPTREDDMPRAFKSWNEMCDYWGLVQRQMVRHVPMLNKLTSELALHRTHDVAEIEKKFGSLRSNPTLAKFIAESRYWLQRWTETYEPMHQAILQNAKTDRSLYLQALSLRIEYLILYIYATVPRYSSLITVRGLTPQYREINALAEELLRCRPNCGFAMDAGWTWPLFVVSFGCRNRQVREEAIRILGQYPIRNALRDSRVFRAIAIKNNETEILNEIEGDEGEQWMRLRRRELIFEDFGSSIIFRFVQRDPVTGSWDLVEEVADYGVGSDGRLAWRRQPISESESILSGCNPISELFFFRYTHEHEKGRYLEVLRQSLETEKGLERAGIACPEDMIKHSHE